MAETEVFASTAIRARQRLCGEEQEQQGLRSQTRPRPPAMPSTTPPTPEREKEEVLAIGHSGRLCQGI